MNYKKAIKVYRPKKKELKRDILDVMNILLHGKNVDTLSVDEAMEIFDDAENSGKMYDAEEDVASRGFPIDDLWGWVYGDGYDMMDEAVGNMGNNQFVDLESLEMMMEATREDALIKELEESVYEFIDYLSKI